MDSEHVLLLASFFIVSTLLCAHLDAGSGKQDSVQIVLGPLEDIDENWEVLSEARQGKHVIAWVPLNVGDKIEHATFVGLRRQYFFHCGVPNPRFTVFRARNEVLGIG